MANTPKLQSIGNKDVKIGNKIWFGTGTEIFLVKYSALKFGFLKIFRVDILFDINTKFLTKLTGNY